MDQSLLLLLSNLLQLHNNLDPTTSLLSSTTSTASSTTSTTSSASTPSSFLSSSASAPLLFLALSSLLSFTTTTTTTKKTLKKPSKPPKPKKPKLSNSPNSISPSSTFSITAFRALSTEHIWSLEPQLRDARWRSLFGLSYPVFTTVVDKLRPFIAASNLSLPSDYAVAMVLSRLSHGHSAKFTASKYSLDPFLVSKITNMVTRLLATKLYPEFIKIPVSKRRLIEATQAFEEIASLPNVCGAIDGSPVRIHRVNPRGVNSSNLYKCRYGFDSVLLQVVADHKKIFWDVCVKAPGGVDDATHFRDSLLYKRLTSGDIVWDKVINVRGHHIRPYIVGDWCYPLMSFLMTPFNPKGTGTPAQNLFDGMLMKGRSVVVEAIGLLKGRWRILQDLNVGLNHVPQTIVACCVLHNLCQIAREPEPEIWKEPDECGSPPRVIGSEETLHYHGQSLRQALADDLHQRLSAR